MTHLTDPGYFTAAEYAGGYDEQVVPVIPGAARVEATLYYQGTSREFVEFLRDEINGTGNTLSSPTPSGEAVAYIAQTDPFFSGLKAWGNTIWELWEHNHGLDGSSTSVPGIVPVEMTSVSVTPAPVINVVASVNSGGTINPDNADDLVPVAILGSPAFDAATVNAASVSFGPGAALDTDGLAAIADSNADGLDDAGLEFLMSDTGITCDDVSAPLAGETLAGEPLVANATITTDCDDGCHP